MTQEKDILKWLNDELSGEEINKLKQTEDLQTLEKIVHYSSQMRAPKVDAQKALDAFKSKKRSKNETKVRTLNFKTFYRVAAVVAIMLTASYFLFNKNTTSFETQIAETQTLTLPDNSEVILNAASKLSFNKKTWKENRNLELDGEAFFKVSKGQKFTVNTDAGTIQVFGTQFNVKEREGYFEVHCYEGLVGVTYNKQLTKLSAGKTFRVVDGSVQEFEDLNTMNPSWLQQESSFVEVPLKQVIAELERQYVINITAENIDTNSIFTGSFTHNDKNIALQSVTIPLKLSYKIDGNKVYFYNYGEQ
jgi:ferric-dicitrate binding protein FerR (iron transport regulator)